jgi:hypothetical protein
MALLINRTERDSEHFQSEKNESVCLGSAGARTMNGYFSASKQALLAPTPSFGASTALCGGVWAQ